MNKNTLHYALVLYIIAWYNDVENQTKMENNNENL